MLTLLPVRDIKVDTATNSLVGFPFPLHPRFYKQAPILTTWLEFDFRVLGDGRSASARYANNSNYRNDSLIRKESASTNDPSSPDSS